MTIKCPHCKGKAVIWDSLSINTLFAVFTLGLSLVDPKETCPKCNGNGDFLNATNRFSMSG